MAMQTIQVRISSEQLEAIDRQIKAGKYQSRSEAIRDYIRKAEFFEALEEFRRLAARAGLKEEEIWQDPEETRKALYQEFFNYWRNFGQTQGENCHAIHKLHP